MTRKVKSRAFKTDYTCVYEKLEGSSKQNVWGKDKYISQGLSNQIMCIPIKISSKVENSTCIFIGSRIREGIKQYQSINPFAKSTGNREATAWKKNLKWKVRNSLWEQLLEKGLLSLKEMMEAFRMFKNTFDRAL